MSLLSNAFKEEADNLGLSYENDEAAFKTGLDVLDYANAGKIIVSKTKERIWNPGISAGTVNMIIGLSGSGKMQPDRCKVLSENGFVRIDELNIGDRIYGIDGNLHNILGITVHGMKYVYEIILNDGSKTYCGLEHLWEVEYKSHGKFISKVFSLKEILNRGIYLANGYYKYSIPKYKAMKYSKNYELEIPPYLMGVYLGDAHLGHLCCLFKNLYGLIFHSYSHLLCLHNILVSVFI